MKTMLSSILTFFLVGFSLAQVNDIQTKFISPKFVPQNSNFQIVALIQKNNADVDSLELNLNIDSEIKLDSLKIERKDTAFFVRWKEEASSDFEKTEYSFLLNFTDSLAENSKFVQVIYFLNSDSRRKIDYHFKYRYGFRNDSIALHSRFYLNSQEREIESYRISNAKGLAKILKENDIAKIFSAYEKENLIFSYWFKFTRLGKSSISLLNGEGNGDSLCIISVAKNGLLEYCNDEDLLVFDDFLFSTNAWYKLNCFIEPTNGRILLFVNNDLLAEKRIYSFENIFALEIKTGSSEVVLEDVKILSYNDSYEKFLDENFQLKELPDSLQVLFLEDFDEVHQTESNKYGLETTSQDFVSSDAPVFLSVPELNLTCSSTYYLLEWKAAPHSNPKEFVIEKSVDGAEYLQLARFEVGEEEAEKTFSFTDEKSFTDEILYYRVLQINKDSSEIYSNQVKVGQGEIEEFAVEQNYPNPFNPVTNIKVEVFVPGEYTISVFDLVGKEIKVLYKGTLSTGVHSFTFDGTELPSGIYFYEIVSPSYSKVMKMILAK